MSGEREQEEVIERRMDWALREAAGGEQAPDVVAAVMARRAAGDIVASSRQPATSTPWLSAAAVVLGLGVVAWLLLGFDEEPPVDEAQGAPLVVVSTLEDIAKLPRDTAGVEVRGMDNDAVATLGIRCKNLRSLRLVNPTGMDYEVGAVIHACMPNLNDLDVRDCQCINDVAIANVIALYSLRRLDLRGTSNSVHGFPLLREARQLRRLTIDRRDWLTFDMVEQLFQSGKDVVCDGGGDRAWDRAVVALRERYSDRLHRPYYRQIRKLDDLRTLPPSTTHIELRGLGDEAAAILAKRSNVLGIQFVRDDNDPLTERTIQLLTQIPTLEELYFGGLKKWHGEGFERLIELPNLRSLYVATVGLTDEMLASLPRMRSLRKLELIGERNFGTAGMASVARCTSLEYLDLTGCDAIGDRVIAQVGALTNLRTLILDRVKGCGDETVGALAGMTRLRHLDLQECSFSAAAARSIFGMRELRELRISKNDKLDSDTVNSFPVSLRTLELSTCKGLDQATGTILRDRFPELSWLDVSSSAWVDDGSLWNILQLPKLRHLEIGGAGKTTPDSYEAIRAAKSLRRLNGNYAGCLSNEVVEKLKLTRPDLKVVSKIW